MTAEELFKASEKQDEMFFEMLMEILESIDSDHNKAVQVLYWYKIGKKEYAEVKMLASKG